MSVGILAHLFGSLPYRELAAKVGEYGFKHVQLALWKGVSDIDFSRSGKLSPGIAMEIGEEFKKHGSSISVLGCYLHMFQRDETARRENTARFKELLRYASFFGAPMVAFETGQNPNGEYTEQDWSTMRSVLTELAEEAQRWGVFVGLEAANGHLVGTAVELHRMLEEVPSSNIGVVLDPGNLLHAGNFARQDEVIEEAFALLGDRIIAAHAKDRVMSQEGQLLTVPAGLGEMNYPLYIKLLEQHKPGVQIVMEEAKEHQMLYSKSFIESLRANQEN